MIQRIPSLRAKIIIKKIPKIILKKEAIIMSFQIFERTIERGIIRLIKVLAGVPQ